MKLKIITLIFLTFSLKSFAGPKVEDSIKRLNWNGVDVVFIEDNRFPTYDILVYFADGALSDEIGDKGLSAHAFNLLDAGTAKLTQKEIMDQFEFFGAEFNAEVTHEYSTLSLSGLSKDLPTTLAQACSLMQEASYPSDVLKLELDKERSELQSYISSPQALSDRIFREVSMTGTPYSYPATGKVQDFSKYTPEKLRNKLDYFLAKVKKRIYLTGPKNILIAEKIFADKCKFKGQSSDIVRSINYKKTKKDKTEIVFIPLPDANQVQVRVGRFMNFDEINDRPLDVLASEFLGGGFTSRLMREVRVKRGLTYSIGSYISSQKQYGRSGISTFTKNETINKLIEVIDETVSKVQNKGITEDELDKAKSSITGAHPFKFENNRAFLSQLLYLDHVQKPYAELFNFNEELTKYKAEDIAKRIHEVYGTEFQTIFILGDKSIAPMLKKLNPKFGKIKVLDFKKFI